MIDGALGPDERALLAAGRDRLGPDAATISRLRARIDVAAATGSGRTAAKPVFAGVMAVIVVGAVGALLHARHSTVPAAPPPAPEIAVVAVEPEVHVVGAVSREPAVPVEEHPRAVATRPPPPTSSTPPPPPRASLAREIELVDRATSALRHKDFTAVLETIQIYDAETAGQGQLAQDASAVAVEARCISNDPTARDSLVAFDHRWPHSAQRPRLAAACPTLP